MDNDDIHDGEDDSKFGDEINAVTAAGEQAVGGDNAEGHGGGVEG